MIEAALGILLVWRTPLIANLIGLLVVLAEMALVGGLIWRKPAPIAWSIVLLGTAFGLSLIGEPQTIDAFSLPMAAGLFLAAELAYLGVEERVFSRLLLRRALASLAVAAGALLVGLYLLAIGPSFAVAGAAMTAAGVAAALVLLGLVVAAAAHEARS